MKKYFQSELARLNKKIKSVNETLIQQEFLKLSENLGTCQEFINNLESNIEKEEFINAQDDVINADDCIERIKDRSELSELPFTNIKMTYWVWIITWTLILILIIIMIIIINILRKRLGLMDIVRQRRTIVEKPAPRTDREISEKLKRIKESE